MLVITNQTGRKLPFDSHVHTSIHHPLPCSKVCPSLACILSYLSQSVSTHIPAYTHWQTQLEFWPLRWASPTFPVWNQVFNTSFILCISTVLSVSGVAITKPAGETGSRMVEKIQSRGCDPELSALCFLRGLWWNKLSHWVPLRSELVEDVRVDTARYLCWPWCRKHYLETSDQEEKLGRGWLFLFDSWF